MKRVVVVTNLTEETGEAAAEKLSSSLSVMLPTLVNRFIQKDTKSEILTNASEKQKINVGVD